VNKLSEKWYQPGNCRFLFNEKTRSLLLTEQIKKYPEQHRASALLSLSDIGKKEN
jgi:hypothetical protein